MSKYIWDIKTDKIPDNKNINKLILEARGILDSKEILDTKHPIEYIKTDQEFINLVPNLINSIKLVKETISKNKPIIIHGDYDVDGQSATAIIWRTIYNDLNYENVFPFIPSRFDHGYGLSESSISYIENLIVEKGFEVENSLIITLDCGITAVKECEIVKTKGFKIIISDHHHKNETVPSPDVLVWTEKATGSGIAWLLSYFIRQSIGTDPLNNMSHLESIVKSSVIPNSIVDVDSRLGQNDGVVSNQPDSTYLDLACLGTICDLQPLLGFNRSVVKYGLIELNKNKIVGIAKLNKLALTKNDLDTYEVGWVIGPKLNASGRLTEAIKSLRLLSTNSEEQALTIAKELTALNKERQDKTQSDFLYAVNDIKNNNLENANIIISTSPNYHEGIIGLISSKLVQTYNRPSLTIAIEEGTGIAKGSGRSVVGISIIETLNKFDYLFEKLGGHDMACGFNIKVENLEKLKSELKKIEFDKDLFLKNVKIDIELPANLINIETYNQILNLKPFGMGFAEPVFITKNLKVVSFYTFGQDNKHFKLLLEDYSGLEFTGIAFSQVELLKGITVGSNIDLVYSLSLNTYEGTNNIQLKIKSIKANI